MKKLPLVVQEAVDNLPAKYKNHFQSEFRRRRLDGSTAFFLWLIGFHYAYRGDWGLLVLYWITAWGFFLWWFVDLILILSGSFVSAKNDALAKDILKEIKELQ
jgi:hypothetical protein